MGSYKWGYETPSYGLLLVAPLITPHITAHEPPRGLRGFRGYGPFKGYYKGSFKGSIGFRFLASAITRS